MDISEIQTLENGLNTFINGIQDVSATAVLASILVVIYFLFKNRKDVKDVLTGTNIIKNNVKKNVV